MKAIEAEGGRAIAIAADVSVEADVVRGRRLTSWPSVKTDIRNAGGTWLDHEAVRDRNLVTSRQPGDIPAFNREMLALFAEHYSHATEPRAA